MHVEAWDTAFVRAGRTDVHPILEDVAAYGRWWPSAHSAPLGGSSTLLTLRPPQPLARRQHLRLDVEKVRPGKGLQLSVQGWAAGQVEWYYLEDMGGVTVHYLLRADIADRGWRRALARHRCAVRIGLHALKERLEEGRPPGAEPDHRTRRGRPPGQR